MSLRLPAYWDWFLEGSELEAARAAGTALAPGARRALVRDDGSLLPVLE